MTTPLNLPRPNQPPIPRLGLHLAPPEQHQWMVLWQAWEAAEAAAHTCHPGQTFDPVHIATCPTLIELGVRRGEFTAFVRAHLRSEE